jgi:protease-4
MLDQVHKHFIETVKQGRGERISDDPDVYSGLFWTGEEALGLGLIDAFGSLDYVARDVIGYKDIVDYTYRPNLLDQLCKDFGVAVGAGIANVISGQIKLQ